MCEWAISGRALQLPHDADEDDLDILEVEASSSEASDAIKDEAVNQINGCAEDDIVGYRSATSVYSGAVGAMQDVFWQDWYGGDFMVSGLEASNRQQMKIFLMGALDARGTTTGKLAKTLDGQFGNGDGKLDQFEKNGIKELLDFLSQLDGSDTFWQSDSVFFENNECEGGIAGVWGQALDREYGNGDGVFTVKEMTNIERQYGYSNPLLFFDYGYFDNEISGDFLFAELGNPYDLYMFQNPVYSKLDMVRAIYERAGGTLDDAQMLLQDAAADLSADTAVEQ